MADFGLKTWDENGVIRLDTTDSLTALAYAQTAEKDTSYEVTLPQLEGRTSLQFAIPKDGGATDYWGIHLCWRTGNTITITAQSNSDIDSRDCWVLVFVYA